MPGTKAVKILIVDIHPLSIKGLAALINQPGYAVIGEAATLADALAIARKEKPDLAIVEINLGSESGLELIPRLKAQNPATAILVLSLCDERYYAERALRLGARGYLMKTGPASQALDAIKAVLSGKVYVRDHALEPAPGDAAPAGKDWTESIRKLTDRELQVFSCVGKGMGTGEIARAFNLSVKTVDSHKEHLKLKLQCGSAGELRQLAIEWATHPEPPPPLASPVGTESLGPVTVDVAGR